MNILDEPTPIAPKPQYFVIHIAGPGDNHPCCGARGMGYNSKTDKWHCAINWTSRNRALESNEEACPDCPAGVKEYEKAFWKAIGRNL